MSTYHLIWYNKDRYSTFECLSSELILCLFEYFNSKEIQESFFNGKYVVGRQIFVDRHLVDRLLSKNFRRHDTSSKYFCRYKHAEVEELLRFLNFKFQTMLLLNLGSEGEGDNYKTTSDKLRVKAKIFKLDHTKWGWGRKSAARINDFYTTKIFCR
jgi:hypothetical protein